MLAETVLEFRPDSIMKNNGIPVTEEEFRRERENAGDTNYVGVYIESRYWHKISIIGGLPEYVKTPGYRFFCGELKVENYADNFDLSELIEMEFHKLDLVGESSEKSLRKVIASSQLLDIDMKWIGVNSGVFVITELKAALYDSALLIRIYVAEPLFELIKTNEKCRSGLLDLSNLWFHVQNMDTKACTFHLLITIPYDDSITIQIGYSSSDDLSLFKSLAEEKGMRVIAEDPIQPTGGE